jgi:hypothetical protein
MPVALGPPCLSTNASRGACIERFDTAAKRIDYTRTRQSRRLAHMRNTKSHAMTASLVLIPPVIASIAYLNPFKHGSQYFLSNSLYIASGSLSWWPFSLFLKRRTFVAGLLGIHAMMVWFLYCMWMNWGDDLGWIFYLPNLLVGCLAALAISAIARKANEWIHRTPR